MRIFLSMLAGIFMLNNPVLAADEHSTTLVIDHQKFVPSQLILPAGSKIKIVIRNQDGMPVEFESYDLSREIIVPAHGEVMIFVGPVGPGNYQFFNDFNHDMQGSIAVNPAVNKGN